MGTITRMDKIIQILDRGKDESLDELLSELIAENDGVAPNAVTPAYIREKREKEIYPVVRYEVGSAYGGYATDGLTVSTRNELEALAERVEKEQQALFHL
jgi:hypothetical protein